MKMSLSEIVEKAKKVEETKTAVFHANIKPSTKKKLETVLNHYGLTKVQWLELMIDETYEGYEFERDEN